MRSIKREIQLIGIALLLDGGDCTRGASGTTVVTDSVTSFGLKQWIESLGGIHHRFKRGYRNVINESIRLNELGISSELALETSGHGASRKTIFWMTEPIRLQRF